MTVHRDLWHCGWPSSGGYPGAYPDRYLRYMREFLGVWEPVLHLFSGVIPKHGKREVTIDIEPSLRPTHVLDLTKEEIPYHDDHFAVVLADPPYDHKDYKASKRHYQRMEPVPRYSFVKEAVRVLKPGGVLRSALRHALPHSRGY